MNSSYIKDMNRGLRNTIIIISTIMYSAMWGALHIIIVGFFMPSPIRFNNAIRGIDYSPRGVSEKEIEDEVIFLDIMED